MEEDAALQGKLPAHGNENTMNIENTLITNIQSNQYFKELVRLKTYHEILDEIYNECHDLQPWLNVVHKTPSTAFCLLYKLFTLRLTYKQLKGVLNHKDSPYIRGLGFLYLRYVCDPKQLWSWFEPYLNDEEELTIKGKQTTIGKIARGLIEELKFCETMLPRIPVPVKREIDAKLKEWDSANKSTKSDQQERNYTREKDNNYSRDNRRDDRDNRRDDRDNKRDYNRDDRDNKRDNNSRRDDRDDRYRRRSRSPADRYRRGSRKSRSRSRSRDRDRSSRSYRRYSRSRSPRRNDRKRGNSRSRSRSPYDSKKYTKRSRTPSPPRTTSTTTSTSSSSTSNTPKQPNKDLQKIMSMYNASTSISIASEKLSDNLDPGYEKITLGKKKY